MDTEFINRIKGYAALFMAVMAAILLVPVDGYSCEREYPDVILDTRLEADDFSGGSLHAYSGGYPFSISGDIRSVPS